MKYARAQNQRVLEVFSPPEGFKLEECFSPSIAALFERCPDDAEANWRKLEDGTFEGPPQPGWIYDFKNNGWHSPETIWDENAQDWIIPEPPPSN